jgi:adenylate cyclase
LLSLGDTEGAQDEVELALATSPSLAIAHGILGAILVYSGRPKEGAVAIQRSMRLDPRDPMKAFFLQNVAVGLYFSRDYDAAIEAANRTIRSYPAFPNIYRWLAAALGQLGRTGEAQGALQKAIALAPAVFDMYVHTRPPWFRPEDHAHMLDGLRKAGWDG